LFAGHDLQNVRGVDGLAFGKEPAQHVVDQLQAFVLCGVEQLEVLFDCRGFRGVLE
jgi:hypothetical protein